MYGVSLVRGREPGVLAICAYLRNGRGTGLSLSRVSVLTTPEKGQTGGRRAFTTTNRVGGQNPCVATLISYSLAQGSSPPLGYKAHIVHPVKSIQRVKRPLLRV